MAQRTAAWLVRPHCWSLPFRLTSDTLLQNGAVAGVAVAESSLTLSCLRSAGLSSGPSLLRGFSDNTVAAAPSVGAAAEKLVSGATPGRRTLPKWLRGLFPGGHDVAPEAQSHVAATAEGQPKEGSGDDAKKSDDEDLKQLDELRTMTMDGYVEYCKKLRSGSAPPRPQQPPVPRDHFEYKRFRDTRRIAFLRLQQHERIGSLITKEEGELILAKREEVLHNRALLEDIADRTGVYIDLEVKDCIKQYLTLRKRAERFHRFVTEFGNPLPRSDEAQKKALLFMERVEAEAELKAALARRDMSACPLRHKLPWAGPSAVCELTGLRYTDCCGRLSAEQPALLQARGTFEDTSGSQHVKRSGLQPDKVQEQAAYHRFKGRAEGRLRRAFLESTRPRFRDY